MYDEETKYSFFIEHATLVLMLNDGRKVACSFRGAGSTVDMTVRRELEEIFGGGGEYLTYRGRMPYEIETTFTSIPEFTIQLLEQASQESLDNPAIEG